MTSASVLLLDCPVIVLVISGSKIDDHLLMGFLDLIFASFLILNDIKDDYKSLNFLITSTPTATTERPKPEKRSAAFRCLVLVS